MPWLRLAVRNWSWLPSVNHGTRGSREGNITVAWPGAVTWPRWFSAQISRSTNGEPLSMCLPITLPFRYWVSP